MSFKVSQGVTTVVAGNCGISAAPLRRRHGPAAAAEPAGRAGDAAALHHLRRLPRRAARDAGGGQRGAAGRPHHLARALTMADAATAPPTPAEIEAMRALVEEALDAGAIGLSTGTFYPPAAAATTEEIIEVGRPLSGSGGALRHPHARREPTAVMESLDETFRIGRELGVPVVVSHHKVQSTANFGRSVETLPRIRATMQRQCVALDCYPYTAGSTMIRTDRGMLRGPRADRLAASRIPRCAGRDLDDIAREWGVAKRRGGAPPAAGQRDLLPDGRGRRAAHPGLRRHHDRLGRHPAGRTAASAAVGHLPARAGPLQPRRWACSRWRRRCGR